MASAHPDSYPMAALVTGAAKRIGRALALDLAAQGFAVAVHYNESAAEAAEVVAAIEAQGGRAAAVQADLGEEAAMQALVQRAARLVGPLGLLVNNASVFDFDDVESATRETWDHHVEPNLRAPLVLTQRFAEQLPAGAGGLVVNMLDARVLHPSPRFLSYTVTKIALWSLTQSLAQALAPRIRVNAIGPGPVLPPRGQTEAEFAQRTTRLPLGRAAALAEIAAALRFLIAAKSVTGQLLALDGGDHLATFKKGVVRLPPSPLAGEGAERA